MTQRALLLPALVAALCVVAAPARAATAVPGQLLVGFHKGVSGSLQKRLVQGAGGTPRSRLRHIRGAVVRTRHHLALAVL